MNKFESSFFTACAAALLLAGCAQQKQYKTVEQICIPNLEKQKAMQTAENVLGRMHFAIDKSDTNLGYIRTRPLVGAQFFEFWRSDNVGTFNSAEANLHSIRRTAELNIATQDEKLCLGCDVNVQRLHLPTQQVNRPQAYQMFTKSKLTKQGLRLHSGPAKEIAWVELGTDPRLETEILKRIERKLKPKIKSEKP